jgi:hypothetical protein
VKIELLNRKSTKVNSVFQAGTLHDAYIRSDGRAQITSGGTTLILAPHEFRVYIPEQDYDKLLHDLI